MPLKSIKRQLFKLIASEISSASRYYDRLICVGEEKTSAMQALRHHIDCPKVEWVGDPSHYQAMENKNSHQIIFFPDYFSRHPDLQGMLKGLRSKMERGDRIAALLFNPYLYWAYKIANRLGWRQGEIPSIFLTASSLKNLVRISGFEVVQMRMIGLFPFHLLGLGEILEKVFSSMPWLRNLALSTLVVLRPLPNFGAKNEANPSLSIIIPARNERGNIENAVLRLQKLNQEIKLEIIFVEGHSGDSTWQEILRVQQAWSHSFTIHCFQQTGRGKNDAVRLGFSKASGDLLTILDADLTMPPEFLRRFYDAWCENCGDFVNGNRLLYPMEGEAMRFLNRCGNVFFAHAIAFVLQAPLGDTLCGTKLLTRDDYNRLVRWREDFGDFDPFGDFELLYGARVLWLGLIDMPMGYKDRVYGQTNIHRFRHGLMLLRMFFIGWWKIRCGVRSASQNRL